MNKFGCSWSRRRRMLRTTTRCWSTWRRKSRHWHEPVNSVINHTRPRGTKCLCWELLVEEEQQEEAAAGTTTRGRTRRRRAALGPSIHPHRSKLLIIRFTPVTGPSTSLWVATQTKFHSNLVTLFLWVLPIISVTWHIDPFKHWSWTLVESTCLQN